MSLKPIPTILLVVFAIILTILLMNKCSPRKVVTVEKYTTVIETDTLRYPEYIPIEKPVVVTKEKKIYITDQKQIDSLIHAYEYEIAACSRNYQNALAQLYQSHVGDTLTQEEEVKLYAGEKQGENYKFSWQIGTVGTLHHFHPNIEVTSSKTIETIDKTKSQALGLHWGFYGTLDQRPTVALGMSYDRSWGAINAVVVPESKGFLVTFNPKIRW